MTARRDSEPATAVTGRRVTPDQAVASLRRWEQHGGAWRVVYNSGGRVTVSLLRCDGGEEVDRFTSTDPSLLLFLAERSASGSGEI